MEIKTKYDIGESVWFLEGYKVQSAVISGVNVQKLGSSKPCIAYKFALFQPKMEHQVFKTKEELIKYLTK